MKKRLLGRILIMAAAIMPVMFAGNQRIKAADTGEKITIAFTHDLHSHIEAFETLEDGNRNLTGGFSRIAAQIKSLKKEKGQVLVVDGGDYSMGTLYQSLYATDSAELSLLADLGYDAVTLGNHELDYGEDGLAESLKAAAKKNSVHPVMVVSNINWEKSGGRGTVIKEGFDAYGGKAYEVITKGNIKIAVFGIFGKDSASCVNDSPLVFDDCVESAKAVVREIKAKESPDLIVCLSHSGTAADTSKSEDELLADKVPGIDVIISGHTHTTLSEPIKVNDTYIAGCGCYGMQLGQITLVKNARGRWSVDEYKLIPINASVDEDTDIKEKVEQYTSLIDDKYLKSFGLTKNQVIARNGVEFEDAEEVYTRHCELKLGNIMSDAFAAIGRKYAKLADDVVIGIVPAGYIRETYVKGDITVDDIFNSYSLGIGADKTVGYPLVCAYLTGSELKLAAEVDASLSDVISGVSLFTSGMKFSFNENRLILNKVTDVCLVDESGQEVMVDNDKLYPVIVDLGTAQSLGRIKSTSFGLLSVVPKDKNGRPLASMEAAIIYDGGKEVKAWDAIRQYMQSFDNDADGIGQIPEKYMETEGRKNNNTNLKLWDLVRSPNKYAAMILGAAVAVIAAAAGIITAIVKLVGKRKKK
ncbi:MAG: bifunctional UDP-sugar hydrolase/5'-nucleotidase [Eubacteriales bacterium]|nr:bifunctional UDP-sugar hydrolase/5'-nucleotidase [Eubacteriales bacterium]